MVHIPFFAFIKDTDSGSFRPKGFAGFEVVIGVTFLQLFRHKGHIAIAIEIVLD